MQQSNTYSKDTELYQYCLLCSSGLTLNNSQCSFVWSVTEISTVGNGRVPSSSQSQPIPFRKSILKSTSCISLWHVKTLHVHQGWMIFSLIPVYLKFGFVLVFFFMSCWCLLDPALQLCPPFGKCSAQHLIQYPQLEAQVSVEGRAYFKMFAVFVPADTYNSLVAFVFRNVMLLHPL